MCSLARNAVIIAVASQASIVAGSFRQRPTIYSSNASPAGLIEIDLSALALRTAAWNGLCKALVQDGMALYAALRSLLVAIGALVSSTDGSVRTPAVR